VEGVIRLRAFRSCKISQEIVSIVILVEECTIIFGSCGAIDLCLAPNTILSCSVPTKAKILNKLLSRIFRD